MVVGVGCLKGIGSMQHDRCAKCAPEAYIHIGWGSGPLTTEVDNPRKALWLLPYTYSLWHSIVNGDHTQEPLAGRDGAAGIDQLTCTGGQCLLAWPWW